MICMAPVGFPINGQYYFYNEKIQKEKRTNPLRGVPFQYRYYRNRHR